MAPSEKRIVHSTGGAGTVGFSSMHYWQGSVIASVDPPSHTIRGRVRPGSGGNTYSVTLQARPAGTALLHETHPAPGQCAGIPSYWQ